MRSFIIVLLILLCSYTSFSSNQTIIDSLENQLTKSLGIKKIPILLDLCKYYQYENSDKVISAASEACKLSNSCNMHKEEAHAYSYLAIGYYLSGNIDQAIIKSKKAEHICNSIYDTIGLAKVYKLKGNLLFSKSQFKEALFNYILAQNIFKKNNMVLEIAKTKVNIGLIYGEIEYFQKAFEEYYNAINLYSSLNDSLGISFCYNNLGLLYFKNNEFDSALVFYNKSLEIKQRLNNKLSIARTKGNIADIHFKRGEINKALCIYRDILYIFEKLNYSEGKAIVLNSIGSIYLSQKEYYKSLQYLLESNKIAKKNQMNDLLVDNLKYLSDNYSAIHNYFKAYLYLTDYEKLKDSLDELKSHFHIDELKNNFEYQAKLSENEILKQDNEISKLQLRRQKLLRNSFLIISVLLLLILVFIINRFRLKKIVNIRLEKEVDDRTKDIEEEIAIRRNIEYALKISEDQFKNMFKKHTAIMYIAEPETLDVIDVNDAAIDYYGYSEGQFSDMNLSDIHLVSYESLRKIFDDCFIKDDHHYIIKHKLNNNEIRDVEVSSALIQLGDGQEVYFSVVHDISARIKAQNELVKAKEKAEESDKLKSAFLANMSHEIRTPMNGILGFSELLSDISISSSKRNEYISIINNSGNHLIKIIDDIIDISKIEANQLNINLHECDVNCLLYEVYSMYKSELESSDNNKVLLKLEIEEQKETCRIITDETRVRQVLSNLVSNAVKYTDVGYIEIGYKINLESKIVFSVKDTGIGIPKEKQNVIFDRFRQSDPNDSIVFGGTGLGLAICKGIIQLLGGEMWVNSIVGSGSTFYFTIPIKEREKIYLS